MAVVTAEAYAYAEVKQYEDANVIIVLGGDGTLIKVAHLFGACNIPIMGVNMGTVGFLSSIEVGETEKALERLVRGEYSLDERMLLKST